MVVVAVPVNVVVKWASVVASVGAVVIVASRELGRSSCKRCHVVLDVVVMSSLAWVGRFGLVCKLVAFVLACQVKVIGCC